MNNELNKFEQQLKEIRLSAAQKKQLQTTIYTKRAPKNYTYPAVLTSFIAMTLFLLFISLQPSSENAIVTASDAGESFISDMPKNIIQWGVATLISFVLAGVFAVLLLFKSTRWNNARAIQYGRRLLTFKKNHHLILFIFAIGLFLCIASGAVIVTESLSILHGYFLLLYNIHATLLLLWVVKDAPHPTCPCCKEPLPKKFIIRRLRYSAKETCPYCDERLYLTKQSKRKFYLASGLFLLGYVVFGLLGIPLSILIGILGWYSVIFSIVLPPYLAQFTDDPQYLW
ncbi:hypothetical protein [Lysinibacillus sp. LZ02]|uniref:hypothetical protein n=1 Tax=Lysinibacillus sp. LZ02 TaxID=3420668 RepID=UPI003D36F9AB